MLFFNKCALFYLFLNLCWSTFLVHLNVRKMHPRPTQEYWLKDILFYTESYIGCWLVNALIGQGFLSLILIDSYVT